MIKSCQKLQKDNEDRMLVFVVKWNLTQILGFAGYSSKKSRLMIVGIVSKN